MKKIFMFLVTQLPKKSDEIKEACLYSSGDFATLTLENEDGVYQISIHKIAEPKEEKANA